MPAPSLASLAAAPPAGSLADPAGAGVIVAALRWLEGVLLGPLATSVAVIAVATLGLMLLSGRANLRQGLTVVLGCFILFGAPAIADGIRAAIESGPAVAARAPPPPAPLPTPPAPPPANPDPYAGAAVPTR